MNTIGVFEAKAHFSELLDQVERGEEVTITRHGKAVARVVPVQDAERARARAAAEGLRKLSEGLTLGDLDWKALRDEGRK